MPSTLLCSNAITGKIAQLSHHCKECNNAMKPQCLEKKHVAYCTECGYIFNVKSRGGCGKHDYSQGFNHAVRNERRGLDADFRSSYELSQEAKVLAEKRAAEEEAHRLLAQQQTYNTQWRDPEHPEYPQKAPPRQSIKNKQGKKQQPAITIRSQRRKEKEERSLADRPKSS
ncbi:hypothetical protein P280DRAFT_482085 [Massarina eburnea CBS 473.64]|uniref:Uncharacterized protein n=1 Tax=Massarina eburnea CBS 473.64 TaxID=1395130 RepID=A0A6A6RSJ5_9PLEO|nr:hypothetical protein P280DRAFT_482085 [Massarina eburnea CBS 473.64]